MAADDATQIPAANPSPREPTRAEKRAKRWEETKVDLKWATALLFVLILSFSGWLWSSWGRAPAGTEDLSGVAQTIFSPEGLVAPFEILALLLLAALIAGVVIAIRDVDGGA